MKALARGCGLTLALVTANISSASEFNFGCYVACPDGTYLVAASPCCGTIRRDQFTCPDGSDAYGYGYESWDGPRFCTE